MNFRNSPAIRSLVFAGTAAIAFAVFPGCTSVQVTSDSKTIGEYKLGYLVVPSDHSFETTQEATKRAFKDLGYLLVEDKIDSPGNATLRARDAHDTSVSVNLKGSGTATQIKIRYGLAGELAPEQQIYQAIARNL